MFAYFQETAVFASFLVAISYGHLVNEDDVLQRVVLTSEEAHQAGAYCNDYTPGQYYIDQESFLANAGNQRSGNQPRKWIVFLEGGGFCQNPLHCASRYFTSTRRLMTSSDGLQSLWKYPDTILGRTLLSRKKRDNPALYDAVRLVIPYCSSDLWLGRSKINASRPPEFHRNYLLESAGNFTEFGNRLAFRGVAIFRTVFLNSWNRYGMRHASQILLAGSSEGAIGTLNQLQWVTSTIKSLSSEGSITIGVLLDSSWLIDFRGSLSQGIDPIWLTETIRCAANDNGVSSTLTDTFLTKRSPSTEGNLTAAHNLSTRHSLPINFCTIIDASYPCCLSPSCVLMYRRLLHLTSIPIFAITSRYDTYLVSLLAHRSLSTIADRTEQLLQAARLVVEYGAIQVMSMLQQHQGNDPYQSTLIPACMQHVYLVTSSLWDNNGIFGSDMDSLYGVNVDRPVFTQEVNGDQWNAVCITVSTAQFSAYRNITELSDCAAVSTGSPGVAAVSIRDAVMIWWLGFVEKASLLRGESRFLIADSCDGINCNPSCPKGVDLGSIRNDWTTSLLGIGTISILSFLIAGMFLLYRVIMTFRRRKLCKDVLAMSGKDTSGLKIPVVSADNALTISCLHLSYSIIARSGHHFHVPAPAGNVRATGSEPANGDIPGSLCDVRSKLRKSMDFMYPLTAENPDQQEEVEDCYVFTKKKVLLDNLSLKFNPGEVIAIMGPSGCGKTTFLELLTGRRPFHSRSHSVEGSILVNGSSIESQDVLTSYVSNAGYVRQLATPYYEELTVRENLVLAANLRLVDRMSQAHKIQRVEQIIDELNLTQFADTQVGGKTGAGLSGGQKRKLCVGLQLIELPKVLFLDEPTSGLDATSTVELLTVLVKVAESGRLVMLSIHQPRLEVVQMFHKILFLCDGQIAFHGSSDLFPGLLVVTARSAEGADLEHINVADQMMDLMSDPDLSEVFRSYYRGDGSQEMEVQQTVRQFRQQAEQGKENLPPPAQLRAGFWSRVCVWETRASLRSSLVTKWYLTLVMLGMCLALGGAYFQSSDTLLLLTALCLWSLGSSLFMTPAIHYHLVKALEIFELEKGDGVGETADIILQTFLRFACLAAFPIVCCTPIIYLMLTNRENMSFSDVFNLTAFYLQLNLTWTAFGVMLISMSPHIGFKLAPLFSCLSGFVGGLMIPVPRMASWYKWLRYINPNFYAFSNVVMLYLDNYKETCKLQSKLECYPSTGIYFLQKFGFDQTSPLQNSLIMLSMAALFLLLAWLILEIRLNRLVTRLWIYFKTWSSSTGGTIFDESFEMASETEGHKKHRHMTFEEFVVSKSDRIMERIQLNSSRRTKSARLSKRRGRVSSQASLVGSIPAYRGPSTWFGLSLSTQNFSGVCATGRKKNGHSRNSTRMLWRYVARRALIRARQERNIEKSGKFLTLESPASLSRLSSTDSLYTRAVRSGKSVPFTGQSQASRLFQNIIHNILTAKKQPGEVTSSPHSPVGAPRKGHPLSLAAERKSDQQHSPTHLSPDIWVRHPRSNEGIRCLQGADTARRTRSSALLRMLWRYIARRALAAQQNSKAYNQSETPAQNQVNIDLSTVSPSTNVYDRAAKSVMSKPFAGAPSSSAVLFQNIIANMLAAKRRGESSRDISPASSRAGRHLEREHRTALLKRVVKQSTCDGPH